MSMFSEIAIESVIRQLVQQIRNQMEGEESHEAREALKTIGRYSLTLFDWSYPDWAKEYEQIFTPGVGGSNERAGKV